MKKIIDMTLDHPGKMASWAVILLVSLTTTVSYIDSLNHKHLREEIDITVKDKLKKAQLFSTIYSGKIQSENETFACSDGVYDFAQINEKYKVIVSGKRNSFLSSRAIISIKEKVDNVDY